MDIYPTLVDLCGRPTPEVELEGQSLRPLLAGNTDAWRGHAISYNYNYNKKLNGLDRTIRPDVTATRKRPTVPSYVTELIGDGPTICAVLTVA